MRDEYFNWLCQIILDDRHSLRAYGRLLAYLLDCRFEYTIPMDGNRAADGVNLRYQFGSECRYSQAAIAYELDIFDCSVLEVMVALAMRIENDYMDNDNYGNRVPYWFWTMVESLGLSFMAEPHFDREAADFIVRRFLNRDYESNGRGGLFTIMEPSRDMRSVEIWYQMCEYLNQYEE